MNYATNVDIGGSYIQRRHADDSQASRISRIGPSAIGPYRSANLRRHIEAWREEVRFLSSIDDMKSSIEF